MSFVSPLSAQIEFQALSVVASGGEPRTIALADFDEDGALDLVAAPRLSPILRRWLGAGDGTFSPISLSVPSGLLSASSLEPADLNNDGHVDLVLTQLDGDKMAVFFGIGNGTFLPTTLITVGMYAFHAEIGDFDENGTFDIAAFNTMFDTIQVFLSTGTGTFSPLTPQVLGGVFAGCSADVDSDGHLDLIVTQGTANTIRILHGLGDGTFTNGQLIATTAMEWAEAGDFDGDGDQDFVALDETIGSFLEVYLGNDNGMFSLSATYFVGDLSFEIELADLNSDGALDILVPNSLDDTVSCLQGLGDGTFVDCGLIVGPPTPVQVVTGDVDGDGDLDIVVDGLYGLIPVLENLSTPALIRGNCNGDGFVDIGDAIAVLDHVFGAVTPGCFDACDSNDDGLLDIGDALTVLASLFGAMTTPLPGPPGCATDTVTLDMLGCLAGTCE